MSLSLFNPFKSFWDHEPENLIPSVIPRDFFRHPFQHLQPWRNLGVDARFDEDKFQANIDVQQFKPDEITVKITDDNTITVEGKHEEKQDEHGFISRQFVRRYVLPKGHDVQKVESRLSSDGVLTITAPKSGTIEAGERKIPITQTGQPLKSIKNN